ncbi:hypothetical protein J4453_01465 [Candidatus Woesearchaeota archaeon]|nr:hypothetical protein [Candidatus Woesearchaeota archaeon]
MKDQQKRGIVGGVSGFLPMDILNQFSNFNRQWAGAFAATNFLLSQNNNFVLKLATQNLDVVRSVMNNITMFDHSMVSAIERIAFGFSDFFTNLLRELEEDKEIYKDPKHKELPFLFAGYLDVPEILDLKDEWKKGGKEKVKGIVLETLKSPEIHQKILEGVKENGALNKRKKIFSDALWAHQQGKYYLSIPALFPIIEGTLVEKYGHFIEDKKCKVCGNTFRATARPVLEKVRKNFKDSSSALVDRHLAQIDYLISYFFDRNPILHGKRIDYDSEDLSAALILATSSLNFNDEIMNIKRPD